MKENDSSGFTLYFEDEGRTGYAYLYDQDGSIVADAWIYNRIAPPDSPHLLNPSDLPFPNPNSFVRNDIGFELPARPEDISARWFFQAETLERVEVIIDQRVVAVLRPGERPGRALLAARDNPVAKAMI